MSEYQYYEFKAVDRPLTPDQIREMRSLSSRAVITPTRFCNTYNYGDFRGNPRKLMETHYDAHVYVSNWGVRTLMLRFARAAIPDDILAEYASDALEWWATEDHTILEWRLEEEGGDDGFDEGEG